MAYAPIDLPETGEKPFTDLTRWRLEITDTAGHVWKYLRTDEECARWPMGDVEKYWLGLPMDVPTYEPAKTPLEAAKNGFDFYKTLQSDDGHWAGEYGGPMFLLGGLVIGSYVSGMTFTQEQKLEIIRYIMNLANKDDGGWGLHIEGHSTVFGTTMNYCALRLLGMSAEHPVAVKARAKLHELGGATAAPSWGKFWLSVLNVYDWDGNNPIPPEIWCLPEFLPFHPSKWWVHVRAVFLPMCYLWGVRFQAEESDIILALRQELYTQDYYSIDWPAQRNNVSKADLYSPHSAIFDVIMSIAGVYDQCAPPSIRKAGIKRAYELLEMDDENTGYHTIAPVSKMMAAVARFHGDGRDSEAWRGHERTRGDYMWMGPEGLRVTGTNGSQLWDVAFITQAVAETKLAGIEGNKGSMKKALKWLDDQQIQKDPVHLESAYRHGTVGAWAFSTRQQGYTVSDCTAEGLKSVLLLQDLPFNTKLINERRLCDSVDLMLTLQNPNGGFASYELVRGPSWLERLNPAEVFGDIMIEYCYPECTTSVITALAIFRQRYPSYRAAEIEKTIQGALGYLRVAQQPEGGWVGSWGICFTYATMFALESFSLVGETYSDSKTVQRACEFLISKQRSDGGWGESYKSCEQSAYIEHQDTQVVQTCWAVMALMHAQYPYAEPLERAAKMVMGRQLPNGSWPQEAIEGVFNKTCAISYPNFKFSFPIWMLALVGDYIDDLRSEKKVVSALI